MKPGLSLLDLICSCGASASDIVGTWKANGTYTRDDGTEITMALAFDVGSAYQFIYDVKSGSLIDTKTGTWTLNGNKVNVKYQQNPGTTSYKYSGGKLKNGSWVYEKVD